MGLLAFVVLAVAVWHYFRASDQVQWTMVHVSGNHYSGDAHLLELPGGHIVLIDTGFERFAARDLMPYLQRRGIDHIDDLVVTHAHRNHYGGIKVLLERLSYIKRIHFNLPPRSACDRETWSTGCDYRHVLDTRELIARSTAKLLTLKAGNVIYRSDDGHTRLNVVFVHDGESPPIGSTDINDTSAVLRLVHGDNSVLFSADLNRKVGAYLARNEQVPTSSILTAPHHGVESAAPDEFLRKVKAKVLMVSNSAQHWLGRRGERIRRFALDNEMRTYVTGLHGNVTVTMDKDSFGVAPERTDGDY